MLENIKPNASLIRLVGLLDQVPDKNFEQYCKRFEAGGYRRDVGPTDIHLRQRLQDYLYPDFRQIMFSDAKDKKHVRYQTEKELNFDLSLYVGDQAKVYPIKVVQSELYLFRGHIGLFSLKIELGEASTLGDYSNVLNKIRNFNAINTNNKQWHEWITENYLNGIDLRSTESKKVEADEYSGSKFKLFTAYDFAIDTKERWGLLYDMGTVSPIGSGNGLTVFSPDQEYFQSLMQNRVAAFKNWEAICLFDGFCVIGEKYLSDDKGAIKKEWDETYFRVYLFRLFFKYNLYRYSTLIANAESDKTVKYRDQFEDFLNQYNISHISFNFLPNLIFDKTGNALDLRSEVEMFRERIRNLSTAIQEKKQAKTNFLLQLVTGLSGLSVVSDLPGIIDQILKFTHWTKIELSIYVVLLLVVLGFGILYYLKPELVKKWFARK